jgi:hypothetical protein
MRGLVRIPTTNWLVHYTLAIIRMGGVGYQTASAGSEKAWAVLILALSFSLVVVLFAALERPQSRLSAVSQQPLGNLLV